MKKVKNISGQTLILPDIGVIESDGIIEVPKEFRNANFEDVAWSKSEERRLDVQTQADTK